MTRDQIIQSLIALGRKEVGVREVGGNNCGPRVREYMSASWLKPAPWAWCAAFQDWLIWQWLKQPGIADALGFKDQAAAMKWRPQTAGAWDLENWGREKGLAVLRKEQKGLPGDLVTFDFHGAGHVGLLLEDRGGTVLSLDGNTNGKGERDSQSGDGVWIKERPKDLVHRFVRLIPV